MSEGGAAVASVSCLVLVLGLAFALPLFFAGYLPRVGWNAELVETTFTIENHIIAYETCSRKCGSYSTCTGSGNNRHCTSHATYCSYPCFSGSYNKTYVVYDMPFTSSGKNTIKKTLTWWDETTTTAAKTMAPAPLFRKYFVIVFYEKADLYATVLYDLSRSFPVGKQFKGYYRASMPDWNVETPYHDVTFLVFAIIFFVIAGIGAIGCMFGGFWSLFSSN